MHHRRISGHQFLMARAANDSGQHLPEPQAATVSEKMPTTTVIIAVVIAIAGVTLLSGLGYYFYRNWKRRRVETERLTTSGNKRIRPDVYGKKNWDLETASVTVSDSMTDVDLEKPKRAFLVASGEISSPWDSNPGVNEDVGWVPQIKSKYGTNILAPKPSLKKQQSSQSQSQQLAVMNYTSASMTGSEILSVSPPPSYSYSNRGYAGASIGGVLSGVMDADLGGGKKEVNVKAIPVPPTPVQRSRLEAPPPTPPASMSKFKLDSSTPTSPPLPSPARHESFAADTTSPSAVPPPPLPQEHASTSMPGHIKNDSNQSIISRPPSVSERTELPRLMSVVDTFIPTLEDELTVKVGDTVRMLEEYQDGWCLAQYVGKFNVAKGVIPRFCLQERRSIVPKHKTSNSSLSSSVSKGSYRR